MDTIIKGYFDGNFLYTINYVNIQKALLTGAFEACIKPIRISQLVKDFNLEIGMVFGKRELKYFHFIKINFINYSLKKPMII